MKQTNKWQCREIVFKSQAVTERDWITKISQRRGMNPPVDEAAVSPVQPLGPQPNAQILGAGQPVPARPPDPGQHATSQTAGHAFPGGEFHCRKQRW